MRLCAQSLEILMRICMGLRSHKDIRDAFDWEATPEGHRYWSKVRQADHLTREAELKLHKMLKENDIKMEMAA